MYLTQIRPKAATRFNWLSLFASTAINTIVRFQKQPFLQTSPICVKYILPFLFISFYEIFSPAPRFTVLLSAA